MTDRELLELAAKAAGVKGKWVDYGWGCGIVEQEIGDTDYPWNPLINSGQALRLAVKLCLWVDIDRPTKSTRVLIDSDASKGASEEHDDDPYAATRLAIVRAAAEIGRGM